MKKYNLALIIVAAIVLELSSFLQYYLTRKEVTKEIVEKANHDMQQSERIVKVKAEVETAVRNIISEAEDAIERPDDYYGIVSRLVKQNPHIVGAGVAFIPGYYEKQGRERLFAPYALDEFKNKGKSKQILTNLIPFDYTEREWYTTPINIAMSVWTEPYMGLNGANLVMCSYTSPIKDKSGRRVAVVFADVPLESLSNMAESISNGLDKIGVLILMLQVMGVFFMAVLIWRASVAYRRWKEKTVDSEKEHLVQKVAKLTEINRRLTERNMKLARQVGEKAGQGASPWYSSSSTST